MNSVLEEQVFGTAQLARELDAILDDRTRPELEPVVKGLRGLIQRLFGQH